MQTAFVLNFNFYNSTESRLVNFGSEAGATVETIQTSNLAAYHKLHAFARMIK